MEKGVTAPVRMVYRAHRVINFEIGKTEDNEWICVVQGATDAAVHPNNPDLMGPIMARAPGCDEAVRKALLRWLDACHSA